MQTRYFLSFNKRWPTDWSSHLDPHFQRYHRQRYIATRAKLLKSMRRLSKWDLGQHAYFFTPRHIRLASHYNGKFKPRWMKETAPEDGQQEQTNVAGKEKVAQNEQDGYKLSDRERLWKEHMERLRKRVEQDPYEAVFGRRFEPFWSGLVPRSMRDDLCELKPERANAVSGDAAKQRQDFVDEAKQAQDERERERAGKAQLEETKTKLDKNVKDTTKQTSSKAYAYVSSSSWNSWTNKAVKSEWDSASGETKHYEYDPISNRMIQVEAISSTVEPVKDERKAIPIPFAEPEPEHEHASATQLSNNVPASLETIDTLTATSIRASMGKPKLTEAPLKTAALSQDQQQIEALLNESGPKKTASSRWDHAEQYYMLEQELHALKAKQSNLVNEERRAFHFGDLARRHEKLEQKIKAAMQKLEALNSEQIQMSANVPPAAVGPQVVAPLQTTDVETASKPLRSAVDRMQKKPALTEIELDDSAAHESTEIYSSVPKSWNSQADMLQADRVKRTSGRSPYPEHPPKWVNELADRQEAKANDKEAAERAVKLSKTNEMLQAEVDRQKLVMTLHEERHKALRTEIAKANEQGHVSVQGLQELKLKISQLETAENKYKSKIAALKQELDLAYEQSSRHTDEFRDQIKKGEQREADAKASESKYKAKLAVMKDNLDQAYKQSSRHADEFKEQIKKTTDLAKQLASQANVKSMRSQLLDDRFARYRLADAKERVAKTDPTPTPTPAATSAPAFKEVKQAYKFVPDDLEAELCETAKETPSNSSFYRFKDGRVALDAAATQKSSTAPTGPSTSPSRYGPQATARRSSMWNDYHGTSKHGQQSINPVDGTTAPVTGNYASPTGFVNYDQIPNETAKTRLEPAEHDADAQTSRIKREEQVFTGTKRVKSQREMHREFRHSYRRRRARRNRIIKFVSIAGAIALTTAYVQGMHIENEEIKMQGSREAWQTITKEYERAGERGIVRAMQEKQAEQKTHSGLFWK